MSSKLKYYYYYYYYHCSYCASRTFVRKFRESFYVLALCFTLESSCLMVRTQVYCGEYLAAVGASLFAFCDSYIARSQSEKLETKCLKSV